jgi:hypothetical protein
MSVNTENIENIEISENTIKTETTVIDNIKEVEEQVTITENLKPFRSINYDKYDILYAAHMKTMYKYVESDIKEEFNTFTENLIDENAICRNKLLNAIDEFKYNDTNTNTGYSSWMRFTDSAFNYRPYQPCTIS